MKLKPILANDCNGCLNFENYKFQAGSAFGKRHKDSMHDLFPTSNYLAANPAKIACNNVIISVKFPREVFSQMVSYAKSYSLNEIEDLSDLVVEGEVGFVYKSIVPGAHHPTDQTSLMWDSFSQQEVRVPNNEDRDALIGLYG